MRDASKKLLEFRLGELFCGPGGLGLGAALAKSTDARISHVWATDIDSDACKTYQANIRPKKIIPGDIRKTGFAKMEKAGKIDALAFGFPCNDFSVVGEQSGIAGVFGSLYAYCVGAVKYFRPKWFFAENVGGLRNADEGNTLQKILSEFADAGYQVYPHLYRFDQYGVPQRRQRIVIIGIRDDQNVQFRIPSPKPHESVDNTAETALRDIPDDASNHEITRQSAVVVERLKRIKPGQNAFTADLPENLKLRINGAKISQIYRRLMPDRPAYTITGSGGGGTHVYHWDEPRALTNRERARLQSFPDNFVFCGQKESVRKQIGMAVPPMGAKVIFEAVLKSFMGIDYSHIMANMKSPGKAIV